MFAKGDFYLQFRMVYTTKFMCSLPVLSLTLRVFQGRSRVQPGVERIGGTWVEPRKVRGSTLAAWSTKRRSAVAPSPHLLATHVHAYRFFEVMTIVGLSGAFSFTILAYMRENSPFRVILREN